MTFASRIFNPTANKRLNELIGFLIFVSATLLFLALASYSPLDPSLNTAADPPGSRPAENWIGVLGAYSSDILLQALGLAAFLLPVFIVLLAIRWFHSKKVESAAAKSTGAVALLVFSSALLALLPWRWHWDQAIPVEGLLGRIVGDALIHYLNITGAYIVALAAIAVALFLATAFSFSALRLWFQTRFTFLIALRDRYQDWAERREKTRAQQELEKKRREKEKARVAEISSRNVPEPAPPVAAVERTQRPPATQEPVPVAAPPAYKAPVRSGIERMMEEEDAFSGSPAGERIAETLIETSDIEVTSRADAEKTAKTTLPRAQGGWKLPSSSLLHRPDARNEFDEQELKELAQVVSEKCAEFDVRGQVVQINPGPVVTTYEFKPEAGIKLSRITGLNEDLCLAMKAESILIERMSGKSTVGIQVPNQKRETIWLREVVESEEFANNKSKLTFSLGKDINGRIMTTELNSMPHLLIAGSTGSGKSVAINAFIMSLLYKASPDQVRLILVDPKRVELGNYDGVPHLYTPIISEPKLASNALRNAVREMERRLKLLAEKGVRNIDQYNRLFEEGSTPSLFEDGSEQKPLPYIVIIVDELADLMMVDGANVEESITRLAQMARAIG
ncbi:MAG TPA: DNA translocase FtsK 4TM domain-containing protein, partial [Clostridia bacterium]|nr:DNA translocase FtsK 4TM domain-containing protein [Clostridia bacterium]